MTFVSHWYAPNCFVFGFHHTGTINAKPTWISGAKLALQEAADLPIAPGKQHTLARASWSPWSTCLAFLPCPAFFRLVDMLHAGFVNRGARQH